MHGPNQVRLVSSTGQWLSRPRDPYPMEVITPWPHMPNLIQLVRGTEQVVPTAMIRYMVVVDLIVKTSTG
jgi:hypothetical protein